MRPAKSLILALLVDVLCTVLICWLWPRPWVLFAAGLAISVVALATFRRRIDWLYFLFGATLGPLTEIFSIRAGAWAYTGAGRQIPVWLPLAWGVAVLVVLRAAEAVERMLPPRAGKPA